MYLSRKGRLPIMRTKFNNLKDTVIISGIDDWDANRNELEDWQSRKIFNENLQALTGAMFFLSPKTESGPAVLKNNDIPSYVFPETLHCPICKKLINYREALNTGKPNRCFLNDQNGKPCRGRLIASRFVVCCENGHLEDFPYSWWVHKNEKCKSGNGSPRMSMFNLTGRNDLESLFIKCEECGILKNIASAFSENAFAGENGFPCSCNHPHIRDKRIGTDIKCDKTLKTRLRTASGVYFPVNCNALLIPPWSESAVQIVEREYEVLQCMDRDGIIRYLRGKTNSKVLSKGDVQDADKYSATSGTVPIGFERYFNAVTIVDKLTVTQALRGFTRLLPWNGSNNVVPLSAHRKDWLPAVQQNGEGLFFRFNENTLREWESGTSGRYDEMRYSFTKSLYRDANPRFSPRYVALHTFAHLLIRQISNECGYSLSSLREKIYCTFDGYDCIMGGALIYLASSDADGSLGGLISIAETTERLRSVLECMLQKTQWCSADPLCISSMKQGYLSLNYAACHDCVLLPETSCEFRNVLLDRASVVGMPGDTSVGLFGECLKK